MKRMIVSGSFDDLRSPQVRFLQEASRLGPVHVQLWTDKAVQTLEGHAPKFPLAEREYFVRSLRYVEDVTTVDPKDRDALEDVDPVEQQTWVVGEADHTPAKRLFCASFGIGYQVIPAQALEGFPLPTPEELRPTGKKKVIVTGCYDWLHTGHVRFFEEVSALGELYVSIGNDENLRMLKGEGHPMFSQEERRYMVQSIRYVHQALISPALAWLDVGPVAELVHPQIYAVNEDGDGPEKRQFSREHGLEYIVFKRAPKEGLPRRQSTELRGF